MSHEEAFMVLWRNLTPAVLAATQKKPAPKPASKPGAKPKS